MSVVIGGTSLSGGTGSVWGTLIGAVLLDRLRQEQV
jgi:ribose/xylose/arabinose/galactoside ABC-type transport system permease subunit